MLISKTPVETRERTFAGIRGAGTAPIETDLALDDSKAAAWVQAYDAAWLGRRWSALEKIFAADVTLVSTDFAQAIVGRETALNHVRNLMARTYVHEYTTAALKGYTSGAVGIITYRWWLGTHLQLDWTVDRERRSGAGRDILVLQPAATGGVGPCDNVPGPSAIRPGRANKHRKVCRHRDCNQDVPLLHLALGAATLGLRLSSAGGTPAGTTGTLTASGP